MAEKYNEVKDFNNGTTSMTLGNDNEGNHLDLGTYVLRLDYEAKNSLQACQLARKVIVGKRAIIQKGLARGVFSTSQEADNSRVTDAEKLNSTCTFSVIVKDKQSGARLANIPLKIGFGVGDDTVYGNTADYDDLVNKYNHSKKLDTVFKTNNNGVATITFHISDFFDATNVDQIRHATSVDDGSDTYKHTIYIRLDGTSDRASNDNYVRAIGYVPCVLGNVPVKASSIRLIPEQNGRKVCGGGYIGVACAFIYDFIYHPNSGIVNPNWADYPMANRFVRTGSVYMMISTDGETFTKVPQEHYAGDYGVTLSFTDEGYIPVESDGSTVFAVRNNKPFNWQGSLWYKLMYRAKAGDTEDKTMGTYQFEVDPSYDSALLLNANIELYDEEEPIIMVAGSGRNVNVGVYDEGDVTNSTPLTHGGLEYDVQ